MKKKNIIRIKETIPYTHCFVYKNKEYPFNFDIFKYFSKFISNNQIEFETKHQIPLVDEEIADDISITDSTINDFIKYVHQQSIELTDENVCSLNYLSKKFEVTSLIIYTEQYISRRHRRFAIELLSNEGQKINGQTETYENIISTHLPYYIKDPRLLTLKVPVLNRILSRFFNPKEATEENSFNEEEEEEEIEKTIKSNQLLDFLFNCLDKYGKEASVLFLFADFYESNPEYLKRLFQDYSEKFDFHYIKSTFIKTLYEKDNEIICKLQQTEERQNEEQSSLNEIKNSIKQKEIENERFREELKEKATKEHSNILNEMKNLVEEIKMQYEEKINNLEKNQLHFQNEINKLKKEIAQMKEKQSEELKKIKQSKEKEDKSILNEIQLIKDTQQKQQSQTEKKLNQFLETSKQADRSCTDENKLEELKEKIHNMSKSLQAQIDINQTVFNQMDGEAQMSFINEIYMLHDDEYIQNIGVLLAFLCNEARESKDLIMTKNYIFIPPDEFSTRLNEIDIIKKSHKIGISWNMIEILFQSKKLQNTEFSHHFKNFDEFYLELRYPSPDFDVIYLAILDIKKKFQSKIKISIFIAGIEGNDGKFYRNKDINYVKLDSKFKDLNHIGLNGAFEDCTSLSQIQIPFSVTQFGWNTFMDCTSLKNVIIPSSITMIDDLDFLRCSSLIHVAIPSSVIKIGDYSFKDCISLNQITIPSSVTEIGEEAFEGCTSLKQIAIPSSVSKIRKGIF